MSDNYRFLESYGALSPVQQIAPSSSNTVAPSELENTQRVELFEEDVTVQRVELPSSDFSVELQGDPLGWEGRSLAEEGDDNLMQHALQYMPFSPDFPVTPLAGQLRMSWGNVTSGIPQAGQGISEADAPEYQSSLYQGIMSTEDLSPMENTSIDTLLNTYDTDHYGQVDLGYPPQEPLSDGISRYTFPSSA